MSKESILEKFNDAVINLAEIYHDIIMEGVNQKIIGDYGLNDYVGEVQFSHLVNDKLVSGSISVNKKNFICVHQLDFQDLINSMFTESDCELLKERVICKLNKEATQKRIKQLESELKQLKEELHES